MTCIRIKCQHFFFARFANAIHDAFAKSEYMYQNIRSVYVISIVIQVRARDKLHEELRKELALSCLFLLARYRACICD